MPEFMEVFLGFGIGFLLLVVLPVTLGLRIWHRITPHTTLEEAQTLRFLGLNLIEPAVNSFVVAGLIWLSKPIFIRYLMHTHSELLWPSFTAALGVTLPMLVLLLPLIGWNSVNQRCQAINRQLVLLGLLRWGVTIMTLIWVPALLGGIVLFIGSLVWCKSKSRQLAGTGFKAVGLGPEGVMVGELQDFAVSTPPNGRP